MNLSKLNDFEYIAILRALLSTKSLISLRKIDSEVAGEIDSAESLIENAYCTDSSKIFQITSSTDESIDGLKKRLADYQDKFGLPLFVAVKGLGTFSVAESAKELYPNTLSDIQDDQVFCPKRMQNKVVIITGGAQGFGAGIAESFFKEGANIIIADLNEEKGIGLAEEFNKRLATNKALFIKCDVSELASVDSLVNEAALHFGGIDVLISNAGILRAGGLDEMTPESFELMTKVNYAGYFNCAKAASRLMKLQSSVNEKWFYDILQINSKSGLRGSNRNFAYAGGKFGGVGLTQSFALELMPNRIKVNSICPGNFFEGPLWSDPKTGLFVQYLKAGKVKGAKTLEDVKRFYEMQVPAGRGCGTEDVAKAAFYAIEQEYETGQAIPVTGGQVMLN